MKYVEVHLDKDKLEFFEVEREDNYGVGEDIFSRYAGDRNSWFVVVKNNPRSINGAMHKLARTLVGEAQAEYDEAKDRLKFFEGLHVPVKY